MVSKKVLLIGIDPNLIDFSGTTSGRDAENIKATGNQVQDELNSLGYEVHNCIIDLGETAAKHIRQVLSEEKFDCIMIGGAIRAVPKNTLLFETIINIIHKNVPASKLCFNTGPETTVDAVLRCMNANY